MYIDIHVHNNYQEDKVVLLLNLFPRDINKINPDGYYSIGLHPWYVNKATLTSDLNDIIKATAA
ncbi:MAG TPA: hypothetical protein VJ346_09380, partial [Bacteroidales bacterium]|nr:hypothetical protein [Bacteroidales bacterium]